VLEPEKSLQTHTPGPSFFYGYVVVGLGFLIQGIFWGTYRTFGIFFNPLVEEFGWSRAAISSAASATWLLFGFGSILIGALTDRFSPRLTLSVCGFLFGLGYVLMSRLDSIWQLYLFYGLIVAIGFSASDVVPLSTIARWFARKRGMATGFCKVGTGIGMTIIPLLASRLIGTCGWRTSYAVLGAVAMIALVSLAQFLKRDPSQLGQAPYGEGTGTIPHASAVEGGLPFQEAIHTRQFWTVCMAYLLLAFVSETVMIHSVPHAVDLGISATKAATMLAIIGGASIASRSVIGIVSDRLGIKRAMAMCFVPLMSALLLLQLGGSLWMLYAFAVLYGLSHGGFFTLISPTLAQLFGTVSHGAIFGIILASAAVGGAIGPVLAGRIFDVTGSYSTPFLIISALSLTALMLVLSLTKTSYELAAGSGK